MKLSSRILLAFGGVVFVTTMSVSVLCLLSYQLPAPGTPPDGPAAATPWVGLALFAVAVLVLDFIITKLLISTLY